MDRLDEVERQLHRDVDTEEVDLVRRQFDVSAGSVEFNGTVFQWREVREVDVVRIIENHNDAPGDSVK